VTRWTACQERTVRNVPIPSRSRVQATDRREAQSRAPELPLCAGQLSRSVLNAAHLKLNPPPHRFAPAGTSDATTGVVVKHAYSLSVKTRPPGLPSRATPRDASRRIDALVLCLAVHRRRWRTAATSSSRGLVRFQPGPAPSKTRRPRSPDNVRGDGLRGSRRGANAPVHICVGH
jgi:hypothetical protein